MLDEFAIMRRDHPADERVVFVAHRVDATSPGAACDSVERTRSVNNNVSVPAPARVPIPDLPEVLRHTYHKTCFRATPVKARNQGGRHERRRSGQTPQKILDTAVGLAARGGLKALIAQDQRHQVEVMGLEPTASTLRTSSAWFSDRSSVG